MPNNTVTRYLAVVESGTKNYSAYIPDVPGCIATGDTLNITEGLALHLQGLEVLPASTLDATEIEFADGDSLVWLQV